jgi:hypothetical protein
VDDPQGRCINELSHANIRKNGSDSVIPRFSLDGEPDPWFEHAKAQVDLRQFSAITPSLPVSA